jgi:hypothetical protein
VKPLKNFVYLILLVTFSWISLLLLTFTVFLLIVPFPQISNDFTGRVITSVLKVLFSSVLSLAWLASLLLIRNYIARISVFR